MRAFSMVGQDAQLSESGICCRIEKCTSGQRGCRIMTQNGKRTETKRNLHRIIIMRNVVVIVIVDVVQFGAAACKNCKLKRKTKKTKKTNGKSVVRWSFSFVFVVSEFILLCDFVLR